MAFGSLEAKVVTEEGRRVAVINLHGKIGSPDGFEAYHFCGWLKQLGSYDVLYVTLDSPGGSAIDAWIIYDYLKTGPGSRHRSQVLITGQCSGEAILIALGCEQILMQSASYIRVRPAHLTRPQASRSVTRVIARLIAQRAGRQVDEVLRWMDENRKFSSNECLESSLCDAVL